MHKDTGEEVGRPLTLRGIAAFSYPLPCIDQPVDPGSYVDYKLLPTYSKQTLLFVHVLRIIFKNCAVELFSKAMAQLYDMVSRQSANVSEENKNILHLGLFLEPMSRHMFFYGSKMCVNCSFHL